MCSGLDFRDGGAKGGDAAGLDGAVAGGEAFYGVGEEFLGAGHGGLFVPCAEVGEREEPGRKSADGEATFADECVAGEESSVALVEEGEVAGDVAGGFDDAEGADEIAFGEETGGAGFDSRDTAFDFSLGFVGFERGIGRFLEQGETAVVGDELDGGGAEFFDEGVDGTDVVHVGVGEEDSADGGSEEAGGDEDVVVATGEAGVDEGETVGFKDEVTINETEAGELGGIGGDLRGFHGGLDAQGPLKGDDLSPLATFKSLV